MKRVRKVVISISSILIAAVPVWASLKEDPIKNQPKQTSEGRIRPDNYKPVRAPILASNTIPKAAEPTAKPEAAKPQAEQDKKTIGRCWKRLMTMVREANQAHRSKN